MYKLAKGWDMVPEDHVDPCRSIPLNPKRKRERFLTDAEFIHDIRHSFASRALALGEGLPIIDRLLSYRRVETTARYAHLARDSVRESAERIAVSIADDIMKPVRQ